MFDDAEIIYEAELEKLRSAGLFKEERVITTPQSVLIRSGDREVLNFCANNYLGLSSHPALIEAAEGALRTHGFGLSSVRFICGTQDIHKALEQRIAKFFGTQDAMLYSSCFDANAGLFEVLLGADDAVISDALNHASIIDGIRLCKAQRHRYAHGDMAELESILERTESARLRLIATDGVFSMDGDFAKLDRICELAERYRALVMVDDSHATGVMGPTGRGTPEHYGVMSRVDVVTSTLGKALGGASGGFTTGRRSIIELLRQRSRPYLFSNTLPPPMVGASLAAFELVELGAELRQRVLDNARLFREKMFAAGFEVSGGVHPIVAVMLGQAKLAAEMAKRLLSEGIYVIGFSYPVVPENRARIRVQLSALHEPEHVTRAIGAFCHVGAGLGVL